MLKYLNNQMAIYKRQDSDRVEMTMSREAFENLNRAVAIMLLDSKPVRFEENATEESKEYDRKRLEARQIMHQHSRHFYSKVDMWDREDIEKKQESSK
jgi:hypothetical protein